MYYNYSKIDSYKCPVKIVISRRGLGKTFGKLKSYTERFITKKHRFIYVVETGEMVKELTMNNGEKFWISLLEFYEKQDTSRKRYFYNKITELKIIDTENENEKEFGRQVSAKITGGVIKINNETAGYIIDMNSFGNLKRNNFNKVKNILIDEFITEKLDKTALDNPRKISSIIQSVGRLRDIEICMLGNAIRLDDPILSRLGFKLSGYGYYKKYDKFGLFAILHFVAPSDYKDFEEVFDKSVAGRFANMIGETNEEKNQFIEDLPKSKKLYDLSFKKNGFYLNVIKDDILITLKELKNGNIACIPFNGRSVTKLYCLTEKEQGYKLGYHIICNKALRKMITDMLHADCILYYSEIEYNKLKMIIKGE
jgi:Podovirus DNA encapsidation protein (Gp16).